MIKWITTTSSAYKNIASKDIEALYFLEDTNEIYKGESSFSKSIILVDEYPTTPAQGKLYVLKTSLEGKIYDGTQWNIIIPSIVQSITSDSTSAASVTAVKAYISEKMTNVPESLLYDKATQKISYTEDGIGKSLDLSGFVTNVTYSNGKLTFSIQGSATPIEIDLPKDNLVQSGTYNGTTHEVTFTLVNGATVAVPAVDLIFYTAKDTSTINMDITNNEISASVKISASAGNSLVANADGLYVNAPDISAPLNNTKTEILNTMGEKVADTNLEIMNLKLKLQEQAALSFIKSGIGYYDTFTDNSGVDTSNTTATLDLNNENVIFTAGQILKMKTQAFDIFNNLDLAVYPDKMYKIPVNNNVNNANSINITPIAKNILTGDKIFVADKPNNILSATENISVVDKSLRNISGTVYSAVDRSTAVVVNPSISTSFDTYGVEMNSKNVSYIVYINSNQQVSCMKSSDNGATWVDLSFPTITGYTQSNPVIAIDSKDNLHVAWYGTDSSNTNNTQIKYCMYNGTSWSQWINIKNIPSYNQTRPCIAIDSKDNVHILWCNTTSSNDCIHHAIFNGTTWAYNLNITTTTGYNQYSPSIAIDSNDNVHAVFNSMDSGSTSYTQVKYIKYNGTTWSSSWVNIQPTGYAQIAPCIAIDSKDNLHVVWNAADASTSYYQIKYSKFNGVAWSTWVNISVVSGYAQNNPVIAIDDMDNPHIVWYGADSGYASNRAKYSKFNGLAWSSWVNLNTSTSAYQTNICICKKYRSFMNPILLWMSNGGSLNFYGKWYLPNTDNTYTRIDANGTLSNATPKVVVDSKYNLYMVDQNNNQIVCKKSSDNGLTWVDVSFPTVAGYAQINPCIAIDSKDNLHAVWNGPDSSNTMQRQIKYSKFNGTTWSAWINISTVSGYEQTLPHIAIDSKDNLHVSWSGYDSSNTSYYQIKYSKFNGTVWSTWTNIVPISGYLQYRSSILVDSKDNLHLIWCGTDSSASATQIKYSKFNGTSWSSWANIQTPIAYGQTYPCAIIDATDNIHVVWHGTDSSSTSYYQIKYSKFNGTTWSAWTNISPVSGYDQTNATISINNSGNLFVLWHGKDSTSTSFNQIKYSKFNGTIWSAWVNLTSANNNQVCPYSCQNYKNFLEPVSIWEDDYSRSIQLYGKWNSINGITLTMQDPCTLTAGDLIPLIDFIPKNGSVELFVKSLDPEKIVFSGKDLNTSNADIQIQGSNNKINAIAYAIS